MPTINPDENQLGGLAPIDLSSGIMPVADPSDPIWQPAQGFNSASLTSPVAPIGPEGNVGSPTSTDGNTGSPTGPAGNSGSPTGPATPGINPVVAPVLPSVPANAPPRFQDLYRDYLKHTQTWEHGSPTAKNPNSSAYGNWQITDATYDALVKKHPELANKDRNDPAVMITLSQDNFEALTPMIDRTPTEVDLHMAHFLGPNGAARFLMADPSSPAYLAASPEAVNANRHVFFDQNGTPLTVGQVYALAAKTFGGDPNMPAPGKNAKGPSGAPGAPAATYQANSAPGSNLFPSVDSIFGDQKKGIADWLASQPALYAKLQALQDKYVKAATPTLFQDVQDAQSKLDMALAAAQPGTHTTAGSVLMNAIPNGNAQLSALQNERAIDVAARARADNLALQQYNMGADILKGPNEAQYKALGLGGPLSKNIADYVENTGKTSLTYGTANAEAIRQLVTSVAGNQEAASQILQQYVQQGGSLSDPIAVAGPKIFNIARGVAGGGTSLNPQQPQNLMTLYKAGDKPGDPPQLVQTLDLSKPADRQLYDKPPQGTWVAKPGEDPLTAARRAGGAKDDELPLDQRIANSDRTALAADTALKLLQSLSGQSIGTGPLSDSHLSIEAQTAIKQLFGDSFDLGKVDARTMYHMVIAELQNAETLGSFKGMNLRNQREFDAIRSSTLDSATSSGAAAIQLAHIRDKANYEHDYALAEAEQEQKQPNFDRRSWRNNYTRTNRQPAFPSTDSLTTSQPPAQTGPRQRPGAAPDQQPTTPQQPTPTQPRALTADELKVLKPGGVNVLPDGTRWRLANGKPIQLDQNNNPLQPGGNQ
jgi:hypothetical protein